VGLFALERKAGRHAELRALLDGALERVFSDHGERKCDGALLHVSRFDSEDFQMSPTAVDFLDSTPQDDSASVRHERDLTQRHPKHVSHVVEFGPGQVDGLGANFDVVPVEKKPMREVAVHRTGRH